MPPQEMTGIWSSVRPKRRYFMRGKYGRKMVIRKRLKKMEQEGTEKSEKRERDYSFGGLVNRAARGRYRLKPRKILKITSHCNATGLRGPPALDGWIIVLLQTIRN